MKINIHSILWNSYANGPGNRIVIWFQGCPINCEDCFNPKTHSYNENQVFETENLTKEIISNCKNIEGLTISGGEPFAQSKQLLSLVSTIKEKTKLSIILLSGYTEKELEKKLDFSDITNFIDVLIAGPYIKQKKTALNLAGSSNKSYHFFTDRYSLGDFEETPFSEIIINKFGEIIFSGISEPENFHI